MFADAPEIPSDGMTPEEATGEQPPHCLSTGIKR
jgi:hypothetical protein